MDEYCSNGTRSGVDVLVVAPYSKVDVPVVELQIHIAGGVRTVPADQNTFRVSMFRDSWDVKILSGIELYAWKQYQSSLRRMAVYGLEDVFCGNSARRLIGLNQNHGLFRIETMQRDLRLNSILA